MTSPLLALFARSLREDSRAKITYLARGGLALLVLVALGFIAATARWGNFGGGAPGLQFFGAVVFINFFVITIAGLSHFASAIAEEKEEQTLGLLRMTNLNALSILLGKSTSRLCVALLLLVAQLPFLILAVTLGGVSLAQVFAACATLAAYIFLLSNLALIGSVIARTVGRATSLTILFLAVFSSFGGLVEGAREKLIQHRFFTDGSPTDALLQRISTSTGDATPLKRLTQIVSTGFSDSPFGWQVSTNLVLGFFAFLIAWVAFTRFCDRDVESAPAGTRAVGFLRRRFRPATRPWKNSLAWKDFNFFCSGRTGIVARLLAGGVLCVLGVAGPEGGNLQAVGMTLTRIGTMAFTIDIAVAASRIFRHEARDQTLSTLAMLPFGMRQIVRRKALGWLPALVPALAILMAGAVCVEFSPHDARMAVFTSVGLVASISSFIGAIFLAYLVAFLSLWMKRGALPLGFLISQAASVIPNIALTLLMVTSRGPSFLSRGEIFQWLPLFQSALHLFAIVVIHRRLAPRLEILAAES